MAVQQTSAVPGAPPSESQPASGPKPVPLPTRARIEFVRGFLGLWARSFGLRGLYLLGRWFGAMEYLVDYKRRRRVSGKLRDYFKENPSSRWRRNMTRRYFMRARCDKMFYTIIDRIPRAKLIKRIKLIGQEHLDRALGDGRGVYVALCHFGAHHVAAFAVALLGYEIVGVRDPNESRVRRYMQNKYRETFPEVASMQMVHATRFPRAIYRHFHENRIVASLLDPERRRGDTTKTFPAIIFGEQRELLAGPIQIALRCGAPTLQGFVVSRPNFYYQLIVTPPLLEPASEIDEERRIQGVLQRYARGVEDFAHAHPDHLVNI